jgi:dihydroorotase
MEITAPDDYHHHLRDGDVLKDVVVHAARQFRRVIVMPNLKPPVRTTADALAYRDRILAEVPSEFPDFQPLMTLYLTDNTSSADIVEAKATGVIHAVKYYPAGATTNSEFGVTSIDKVIDTLQESYLSLKYCS